MLEFFNSLLRSDYMPHGHCYLWQTDLLWLHVGSDGLIALSYFSIPFALAYFVRKRTDLIFKRILLMFGAFILACGLTHALGIWSVWHGSYYLTGTAKLITGVVSMATAISIWPLIPRALSIPSPAQLKEINTALQKEVEERRAIEQELRKHKDELEELVSERTKELKEVNAVLRKTLEEQARYARTLQQSEERFALAVEGSNSGIWDWFDVKKDDEWWSPRFYHLLGYKDGEIEASLAQFQAILHPEDHERTFALVEAYFEGRATFDIEYRLKTKSEGYKWFQGYGALSRDEAGNPTRMVGSITDIDGRKNAEASLKKYMYDLEIARDHAEAANKTKSLFLANMSHEIRTPMNGVIGMSSLLLDTPLNEDQKECVEVIVSSGESLLTVINDILDFSKIEAGRIDLEYAPFSLIKCLRDAINTVFPMATNKGLDIILDVKDEVPGRIVSDIIRVRQVILNLLSNAVKFTQEGEIRIVASVLNPEQDLIQLEVIDTGIGIPADKIDMLFDSFTQVDASITRKYGGTGLGLTISYQLAVLLGGSLRVESTLDVGTTFFFSFKATTYEESPPTVKHAF